MDGSLSQTPLFQWHSNHGGRLVDFAGWAMPVQYTSISAEHVATREAASLFDVSHMGRFRFSGESAEQWLQGLVSRRIDTMTPGMVRYSLLTRDDGGVLDDILVYRLPARQTEDSDPNQWMLVVNASNREKVWDWLAAHAPTSPLAAQNDTTHDTAMIAVQGPLARQLVIDTIGRPELATLENYHVAVCDVGGEEVIVSRTGYTGEDGFELVVAASQAESIWTQLLDQGSGAGVMAAGLGARDTLRLEAAMPLYGHELSEERSAADCGLDFAIHLEHSFPGRDAIAAARPTQQRIGILLEGRRVAREGAEVWCDGSRVGEVTSGTFSPTMEQPIGMAYVDSNCAEVGQAVEIDIRGKRHAAKLTALPFYRRKK